MNAVIAKSLVNFAFNFKNATYIGIDCENGDEMNYTVSSLEKNNQNDEVVSFKTLDDFLSSLENDLKCDFVFADFIIHGLALIIRYNNENEGKITISDFDEEGQTKNQIVIPLGDNQYVLKRLELAQKIFE